MDEGDEDYVVYGTPIEREEETSARKRRAIADAGQLRALPPWKQEVPSLFLSSPLSHPSRCLFGPASAARRSTSSAAGRGNEIPSLKSRSAINSTLLILPHKESVGVMLVQRFSNRTSLKSTSLKSTTFVKQGQEDPRIDV